MFKNYSCYSLMIHFFEIFYCYSYTDSPVIKWLEIWSQRDGVKGSIKAKNYVIHFRAVKGMGTKGWIKAKNCVIYFCDCNQARRNQNTIGHRFILDSIRNGLQNRKPWFTVKIVFFILNLNKLRFMGDYQTRKDF